MDSRKTLLIGWDAADWKLITPLMEQGKMPNLKKLVEQGVSGNLTSLSPVLSPMLWTSIATGKRPYKHGIHGFSEPDPLTGTIRPVTNLSRKTKAIWNILNQESKNTATIGWWPSNPVEELSRGIMVSNDYQKITSNDPTTWTMKPGTVHPERLQPLLTELRFHPSELETSDLQPFLPSLAEMSDEEIEKVNKDPRVQSLMKIISDCTTIHSATTALMQNEPWDLLCVYHDAIDHFGHAFMKYHPPKRSHINDWDYKVFHYCMEAGYRYHDMMLGSLLKLAGEYTTVILMSDHGFHPDDLRPNLIPREPAGPAAEHRQLGIFAIKGPGIKKNKKIYGAGLLDICPTLLHLHGLPVGEDMDGKVLTDIYQQRPESIETIPSWDAVEGDHGMHAADKQISPADSKAALDQLVALGYIQEPDLNQARALEKTVRELDFNLAQSYLDGGIYSQATTILERLYQKWPMEHRFGFQLCACYKNQNKHKALRSLVNTLIERRLSEAREAKEELKLLKESLSKSEKLSEQEQKKLAIKRKELLGKASPNIYTLRYLEAYADFAEGLAEQALEKLDQLDAGKGAKRTALNLRGDIYARIRKWDLSTQSYKEALTLDEEFAPSYLGLARVAIAQRDFKTASQHAFTSLQIQSFQPKAYYLLGIAFYRLRKIPEAEQAFAHCVKQAPLFAAAYRKLADIARHHKKDPHLFTLLRAKAKTARAELRNIRQLNLVSEEDSSKTQDYQSASTPELQQKFESDSKPNQEEVITIVSGLPRSGTSLMMQLLEAAGISALTDGNRKADDSNKKGYFEHDAVAKLMRPIERQWLREAKGKSLKVVSPLLAHLPSKLRDKNSEKETFQKLHYQVIFMNRDIEEILHSQTTMLDKLGKAISGNTTKDVSKAYLQQVISAKQWCATNKVPAIEINYKDLVESPQNALPMLTSFLGLSVDSALYEVIDPNLYRSKKVTL